jgi:hypothetical protein
MMREKSDLIDWWDACSAASFCKKIEMDFTKKRSPPFNSLPSMEGKRPGFRIKSGMTLFSFRSGDNKEIESQ